MIEIPDNFRDRLLHLEADTPLKREVKRLCLDIHDAHLLPSLSDQERARAILALVVITCFSALPELSDICDNVFLYMMQEFREFI